MPLESLKALMTHLIALMAACMSESVATYFSCFSLRRSSPALIAAGCFIVYVLGKSHLAHARRSNKEAVVLHCNGIMSRLVRPEEFD